MRLTAAGYRLFWAGVGARFPDLGGAASTRYYAANEERLFAEHLAPLDGLRILKTDLWDEAKNTRILAWAANRGARGFGVDISEPTARLARAAFTCARNPLRAARLLGAGEALREATGHVLFPVARPCYEDCLTSTRQALAEKSDPATSAAAWRAGRALSREESISEALKR